MRNFVDAHCDTIVKLCNDQGELFENDKHLDLKRLGVYGSPIQFFALWLDPIFYTKAMSQTMKYLDFYYKQMEKNSPYIGHVNSFSQILDNKSTGRISGILSLEGGEALEGEISALHVFHRLGVRAMTLTWNHRNPLADGVAQGRTGGGLTTFGVEVVKEMESLGMIVDVSHLGEAGFWDVVHEAKQPFIASHSNARTICNVPRNLTDDQLRAVAEKGGVVGLNFYTPFLSTEKTAGIEDIIRHTEHMIKVMGEDFIGLGSDFDGIDQAPIGLETVARYNCLFQAFDQAFGREITDKILEGNMLRVLREIL